MLLVRLLVRDAVGKIVLESNAVPAYAFSQGLFAWGRPGPRPSETGCEEMFLGAQ